MDQVTDVTSLPQSTAPASPERAVLERQKVGELAQQFESVMLLQMLRHLQLRRQLRLRHPLPRQLLRLLVQLPIKLKPLLYKHLQKLQKQPALQQKLPLRRYVCLMPQQNLLAQPESIRNLSNCL